MMRASTPFFKDFGPLLFGRPPVPALSQALAKFSACSSLSLLRNAFGSCIPRALLKTRATGGHSRERIYSLEAVFWSFLDQVQTPNGACREAVRKVFAFVRRKFPRGDAASMSANTSAYCQARAKLPLDTLEAIDTHLVECMEAHVLSEQLWHGRRVRIVDGTGASMPDTRKTRPAGRRARARNRAADFPR